MPRVDSPLPDHSSATSMADDHSWVVARTTSAAYHTDITIGRQAQPVGIRRVERQIELRGALTDEQRQRLLAIADRCPVKQTFERGLQIVAAVEPASP